MNKTPITAVIAPEDGERLEVRLTAASEHVGATWSAHLAAMELRDGLVVELYEGGWKVRKIAELANISQSRVHSIVASA